jgi:hypothetical protein
MASFESGHVNVNCEVLDCLEVMAEVSRTLEVSAKKRGILFTVDTSANLPSIVADRGRLIQVLLNLGSNAIKYNVEGGWVLLTALPYDDVVRFIVRDSGKGIPAERQREIFEPFNRLGVELTQEEGSGIGLTISRRLVQAMDGKIGFESFVGQGSKFWVELPMANETAAKMARVPSLFATAADTRCKILYIEDKIPNVELMRAIIEDLNHTRFVDAQTIEEGLKIARSLRPDLVITDIHLPDGKGFDTDQCFVICANVLGGCRGTTGPSSINPATGCPYAMAFPVITIGDMVRLQKMLIDSFRDFCVLRGRFMGAQTPTSLHLRKLLSSR